VHLARGVTTWVPTHAPQLLVTRPGSISALLTYHACRVPPGTWPSHGSYFSQWFSNGGAYCRVPTPHAQILRKLGLSLLVLGVWLGNHLSLLLLLFRGTEARGLHAPIVPPPTRAAPSTVTPTRGYRGVAPPNCKHFLVRTQSTPEASQRPRPGRPPFSPHCASDGSYQVLTLVNTRGRVGTILT